MLEKLKNPATQLAALTALTTLGQLQAATSAKLVPLLTASDAAVRALAVNALTEVNDAAAAPAIQKALDVELKNLAPMKVDWVTTPMPQIYEKGFDPDQPLDPNDPQVKVRSKTADLFQKIDVLRSRQAKGSGKVAVEARAPTEVVADATEEQLKVFAALVRAAGVFKLEGMTQSLEALTHESSPSVRGAAWAGLIALNDAHVEKATEGLFDGDRMVQTVTAQALANAGPRGTAVLVDSILKMSGDRSRLFEAIQSKRLEPDLAKKLLPLLSEGASDAGLVALVLANAGAADVADQLMARLDDASGPSHREYLQALGLMKNSAAIPAVGRELFSDSEDVRLVAIRALQVLDAKQQVEALDALKGDYFVSVREAATDALKALAAEGKH